MNKKVTILGAGPAGLAAGLELIRNGLSVRIIEAEPNIGGLCASVKYKDYIFDYGGHRLYTDNEAIVNEIKEIMGNELKLRKRSSSIFIRGKFIEYPLRFKNLLLTMNTVTLFWAVVEYLIRFIKNKLIPVKEKTLKDWILNRFGRVLYDIYFRPYTEKFWGLPIDKLSIEWASKRITLLGFWDIMVRLFTKKKSIPATYVTEYFYPDRGIGRIFERMADEIIKYGGKINLNSKVTNIEVEENRIKSIIFEKDGIKSIINSDYVISTIPITRLMCMITPKLNREYLKISNTLKYRSLIFLFLIVNKNKITDNNWIYFPEKKYIFSRFTEPKNWSSLMAPEDKTSLCVEVACQVNDKIWNFKDSDIFKKVVEGLETANFLKRNDIEENLIVRWEYAYPIYTGNYSENVKKLLTLLSDIMNLSTCGRQGEFNYGTTTDAMKLGLKATQKTKDFFKSTL